MSSPKTDSNDHDPERPADHAVTKATERMRQQSAWALSVFGKIKFYPTFVNMSNGRPGFILIDRAADAIDTICDTVSNTGSGEALVRAAIFVERDGGEVAQSAVEAVDDPKSFERMIIEQNQRQYVVVVIIRDGEDSIEKCTQWAAITDEVP